MSNQVDDNSGFQGPNQTGQQLDSDVDEHKEATTIEAENCCTARKWRILCTSSLLIAWLLAGMGIFYAVESPAEADRMAQSTYALVPAPLVLSFDLSMPMTSLENLTTLGLYWKVLNKTESVIYIASYDESAIVSCNDTQTSTVSKWDLPGSLFFSLTVVTSIGYGTLFPTTDLGKALCVVYAIIGIPLAMINVADIGLFLHYPADALERYLVRLCSTKRLSDTNQQQHQQQPSPTSPPSIRLAVSVFGAFIFVFFPSIVFVYVEGWDYTTSLYYSYVSLSTIGFGDYVAGQKANYDYGGYILHGLYRVFLSIWIFFGMAAFSLFIAFFQATIDQLMTKHSKRITQQIKPDPQKGKGKPRSRRREATKGVATGANFIECNDVCGVATNSATPSGLTPAEAEISVQL